jgi:alpha-mannosidase
MVDGLSEECSAEVQKIVDKVFELYAPMAQRQWLLWGGELLFSDLQEAVEREGWEAEAKRWMEEEAAEEA